MSSQVLVNTYKIVPLEVAIEEYRRQLEGCNENTHRAKFKYDLPAFVAFFSAHCQCRHPFLSDFTRGSLERFTSLRLVSESVKTVLRRVDNIKHFATWCCRAYPGFPDPTLGYRRPVAPLGDSPEFRPEQRELLKTLAAEDRRFEICDDFEAIP